MIQWRNGTKKWYRIGFIITLSLSLMVITLFALWSNVEAGLFGGGPGNCGNFDDAVRLAQDGDVVVQMAQPRDSGDVFITESLRISGGWFPSQNCEVNNQYFTTTADYLAWGFDYVAPTQKSELNNSGSVLRIENQNHPDFPNIDRLVLENLILDTTGTPVNGGGIIGVISGTTEVFIDNVAFEDNYARDYGGGLMLELFGNSHLVINESAFMNNVAEDYGGGGLYVELWDNSRLSILNSQFLQNSSIHGGAFSVYVHDNAEVVIKDSEFGNNWTTSVVQSTGAGGRIVMDGGRVSIDGSQFRSNNTGPYGGGLYIEMAGGEVEIKNSIFEDNDAEDAGGGLYIESIGDDPTKVTMINTQFVNNNPNPYQFIQSGTGVLDVEILDEIIYLPAILKDASEPPLASRIISITLDSEFNYVVEFETNFEPDTASNHVHFFFDTVEPQYAGTELCPISDPTQCKWVLYGGSSPFVGYSFAERPFDAYGADKMCILVANSAHEVLLGTGNCVSLP